MARTISKRRSVRSTRSKRTKIVGGMKFTQAAVAVAILIGSLFVTQTYARARPPSPDEALAIQKREDKLKDVFKEKFDGIRPTKIGHTLQIPEGKIDEFKKFLEEKGYDDRVEVQPNGTVRPIRGTHKDLNTLFQIFFPDEYTIVYQTLGL